LKVCFPPSARLTVFLALEYGLADSYARCYDLAVGMLRKQYLIERLPGETAEQWRDRKQSRRILEYTCQNPA